MAILITNMDIPETCGECILHRTGAGHCELGIKIDSYNTKSRDCPLKSVDEMMEEIQDYRIMVNPINYILSVINKYCKGEQPYKIEPQESEG